MLIRLTQITRENYTKGSAGYNKTGTCDIYVRSHSISAFVDGKVFLIGGQTFGVTQTANEINNLILKDLEHEHQS